MKLQKVKSTGNAEKWKVFSFDEANTINTSSDSSDLSDDFDPIDSDIF